MEWKLFFVFFYRWVYLTRWSQRHIYAITMVGSYLTIHYKTVVNIIINHILSATFIPGRQCLQFVHDNFIYFGSFYQQTAERKLSIEIVFLGSTTTMSAFRFFGLSFFIETTSPNSLTNYSILIPIFISLRNSYNQSWFWCENCVRRVVFVYHFTNDSNDHLKKIISKLHAPPMTRTMQPNRRHVFWLTHIKPS